ncbi:DUF1737 domain-containing protein [Oecophyllibacter saccharovorans]|uniref:DUF1737 domain-containing protein n=1 Tax=Oecophyllibacter saccharovorans TaxID=2558360 RepID=UPI001145157D|nr:DUF1737 domain-containing protein [Oecophyllibacter saccharovorans]QDH15355.1 DUF1737 domain-containing protein [Oecophyllibacter saccharovorans]
MEYYLCDTDSPSGLTALVNEYLGKGYQLYGDVTMYNLPNGGVRYNQAMTRQSAPSQAASQPAATASKSDQGTHGSGKAAS